MSYMRCGGIKNYRVGDFFSSGETVQRVTHIDVEPGGDRGTVHLRAAFQWEEAWLIAYNHYRGLRWKHLGY